MASKQEEDVKADNIKVIGVQQINRDDWAAMAASKYGEDKSCWEFKCPACGHVQSVKAALERDASVSAKSIWSWIYYACEGRHNESVGCNWSLGGLFKFHEREVMPHPEDSDRSPVPVMLFGDEEYLCEPFHTAAEIEGDDNDEG